jgi:hypothetical protein
MLMVRCNRVLALVVLLVIPLIVGTSSQAENAVVVEDLFIDVDGRTAHGLIAVPAGTPDALVVVTRGYQHSAESHRNHLRWIAEAGAVGVAMDFEGDRFDFPLARGAAETLAAIAYVEGRFDFERRILFSVSMGTPVGAMVLVDLPDHFDYWVAAQPMANVLETYLEAKAICPAAPFAPALSITCKAASAIENETNGGDPAEFPPRMAVTRVAEFSGLDGVIVIHGPNDGLVPYNQGRELNEALRASLHTTDFYTVLRGEPGAGGTTITGHAMLGGHDDGLAGHGTESNETHTLTILSWDLTLRLLADDPSVIPANREFIVDRELGRSP